MIRDKLVAKAKSLKAKYEEKTKELETEGADVDALMGELTALSEEVGKIKEQVAVLDKAAENMEGEEEEQEEETEEKSHTPSPTPKPPAIPMDYDRREVEHCKSMVKFLQKGAQSVSDRERDTFGDRRGIKAPDSLKALLLGPRVAKSMYWRVNKAINPTDDVSLVPNQYDPVLSRIGGDQPNIMDMCRIVPTPRGNLQVTRLDRDTSGEWGVVVVWTESGSTKSETEPTFEQQTIDCYEITGWTEIADIMFNRSLFDIMAQLADMFRGDIKLAIDKAIIQGSGSASKEPTGVIGYSGAGELARDVASQVSYSDLNDLQYDATSGINPRSLERSAYVLSRSAFGYLMGLEDDYGRPLFRRDVTTGEIMTLLGRPFVVTSAASPSLGTEGDVILGDWGRYTVALENDIVFATDQGIGTGFTQNRTRVKAFANVGGSPVEPDAFAYLTDAS